MSEIRFKAIIAPILTGIKVSGDGGGMRVQFDIPESEMANAAYLLAMRNAVLEVVVKPYEDPLKQRKDASNITY